MTKNSSAVASTWKSASLTSCVHSPCKPLWCRMSVFIPLAMTQLLNSLEDKDTNKKYPSTMMTKLYSSSSSWTEMSLEIPESVVYTFTFRPPSGWSMLAAFRRSHHLTQTRAQTTMIEMKTRSPMAL